MILEPDSLLRLVLTMSAIPLGAIVSILVYLYKDLVVRTKATEKSVTQLNVQVAEHRMKSLGLHEDLIKLDKKLDLIIDRLLK